MEISNEFEINYLGSFVFTPDHTFYPYKSYEINNLWLVFSFKSIEKERSKEVYYKQFAVFADSAEEAVKEGIKSYFRNKCKGDEPEIERREKL